MGILIRLAVSALTLWLSTLVFDGITVGGDSVSAKVLTLVLVAIMFGIANAVIRPIIKAIGCWAYVLTLGLVALVVNGALLMLTSFVAGQLDLPFHVDKFWPTAVLGALFIGVVSWLINFLIPDGGDKKSKGSPPRQQYPRQQYPGQQYPGQQYPPQYRGR
jgi:putative membrane protein